MTSYIIWTGPPNGLYTPGREYKVTSETDNGWIIKDDMSVTTNVSKKNNLFWKLKVDL